MSSAKRKTDAGALSAGDSNANKKPKVNSSITSFFGAPKPSTTSNSTSTGTTPTSSATAPAAPAIKFDKDKWVASLTPEQRQFLSLEIETLDPSWLAVLRDEIVTPQFLELKKFLDREAGQGKKIFPPREDIYSWSRHTPFHNVKCVILGQDPYHNVNQAHGLAFSVRPPTPAPPSLRNMYAALRRDYPGFRAPPNNGGLLTPWAERGVLMLNTCLTVRAHDANSHANRGWERFTQRVIDVVAQRRTRGVVFLAWGTPAGKRVQKVDRARHLVLQSVHPSPLSASRGFFDCGHFRKANEWLVTRYGEDGVIDWDLHPAPKPTASTGAAAPAKPGTAPSTPSGQTAGKAKPTSKEAGGADKKDKKGKDEDLDDDGIDDDELEAAAAAADAAVVAPPVAAVGKVEESEPGEGKSKSSKGEEKSEILEKQGEEGTAPKVDGAEKKEEEEKVEEDAEAETKKEDKEKGVEKEEKEEEEAK